MQKANRSSWIILSQFGARAAYVSKNKHMGQLIWGAALVAAGLGVFVRTPQVMPRIANIEQFVSILPFIRFCFYFMGILLIGGGAKKIYDNWFKDSRKS
jgi:hypothetical protein